LGSHIYRQTPANYQRIGTSTKPSGGLIEFDLAKSETFDYELIDEGDCIILTAAISNPDTCTLQYDLAWSLNVDSTSKFISCVLRRGAKVVFCSSDAVLGEREDLVDESSKPDALGEYAAMKLEVESQFSGNPLFKAIRLSYIFSKEDKFTRYLLDCSHKGVGAEIFHPFYRAVIYRQDVIEGIFNLIRKWSDIPNFIIHFGGQSAISRIYFTELLQQMVIPKLQFKIVEPSDSFFLSRPRIINMKSPLLHQLLGRSPLGLGDAIHAEFISVKNLG
jgi:dTDP-4-dehydrorhamnose reductase